MKKNIHRAGLSMLLCGGLLFSLPAYAAGVGGTPGGGMGAGPTTGAAGTSTGTGVNTTGTVTTPAGSLNRNAAADANAAVGLAANGAPRRLGPSTSTGAVSTGGADINNATAGNNAGSVDITTQTPAGRMSRQAQADANEAASRAGRPMNPAGSGTRPIP